MIILSKYRDRYILVANKGNGLWLYTATKDSPTLRKKKERTTYQTGKLENNFC